MNAEQWRRIQKVFHEALELDPGARVEFLKEASDGDEELREQVEALIAAYEEADNFMSTPAVAQLAGLLAVDQANSLIGQRISHYEIVSQLGGGGMGEVYLAQDSVLKRRVALKFLPSEHAQSKERFWRFKQEAKAISALNHPNILTIHEVGEANGRYFIATEFVEGETLRRRMNSASKMKLNDALEVAIQVASALSEAHEAGITHRDIKPENIMIRRDGYVKVLDFGLAKLGENDQVELKSGAPTELMVKTEPGLLMGTVRYMSPEQARGLVVDARTDIWSLGVVLYEMVSGSPPFEGPTQTDTIIAIAEREPAPLSGQSPEVPVELEGIVTSALRKNREERQPTARELLTNLRQLKQRLEFELELERATPNALSNVASVRPSTSDAAEVSRARPGSNAGNLVGVIKQHKKSFMLALATLVVAAAVVVYFYSFRSGNPPAKANGKAAIGAMAVLPFVNVTGDPNMEYLSDGITESLINSLAQIPNLKMIASSSVLRYKGRATDPRTVGLELGVQAVLTGRVIQRGEGLSISAELVDVSDNGHIWGNQYNRKLSDLIAVQEEISREISEKLRIELTGGEQKRLTKNYTQNIEAYQLYLKGRYYWNKRTEEGVRKAIEYFQQAIDKDPNYALAYSGLADCYNSFGFSFDVGLLPPHEAIPKAKAEAAKALALNDTLAEGHTSVAYSKLLYDWDWSGSEREFRRALELDPNYVNGHHWYAHHLIAVGRTEESLAESKRSLELDPLGLIINTHLGWYYIYARQYDLAIEQLGKTLEIDPSYGLAHWYLGLALEQKGLYAEATKEFRQGMELLKGNLVVQADLGHCHAVSGKRNEARAILRKLEELAKERHVSPFAIALIYIGLGEKDHAFDWLEKAYQERSDMLVYLKVDPRLDSLRAESRFSDLVRRVGL